MCSSDQAILREFSQWPNAVFKIPDLFEWLVLAQEPSVINEIQKAPEDLLSAMDSLDEVSSFLSSPR